MRLFVALDLPDSARQSLAAVRPAAVPGIRLTPVDQMHVTVHFIGDGRSDEISAALAGIEYGALEVSLQGVGQFRISGGRRILWAGVRRTEELIEFHKLCGDALRSTGFRPERRPWVPHVTLARPGQSIRKSEIESWLSGARQYDFGSFSAGCFELYNSVNSENGPRYEVIRSYELQ